MDSKGLGEKCAQANLSFTAQYRYYQHHCYIESLSHLVASCWWQLLCKCNVCVGSEVPEPQSLPSADRVRNEHPDPYSEPMSSFEFDVPLCRKICLFLKDYGLERQT
ncbi:uncharacterized protein LOC125025500 [Penaeus chinensis]|uniref:uncharacterized protein LOC125025500 n=1 Tax=Penaeus chinensis TaxID=139456 RepID=UPI001FB57627|nr:uncharacterized protein LOC125025500 [Penaeus chinensis]